MKLFLFVVVSVLILACSSTPERVTNGVKEETLPLSWREKANGKTEGGQDIWVMDRNEDGWGAPYNLGEPINSDGSEAEMCGNAIRCVGKNDVNHLSRD